MRTRSLSVILPMLAFGACGEKPVAVEPAVEPSGIHATFYPLAYWAGRLVGGAVEVVCPVPPDADPAHWMPSRPVLLAYQRAALIAANGAGFERWLDRVSLPRSRVVRTAAAFEHEWIRHEASTHSHGGAGTHSHGGLDGHTWLDPVQAKAQVASLREAIAARFPDVPDLDERFRALASDLDGLDARLRRISEGMAGVRILCAHPAYNYLARRYGWEVVSLDLDPAAELSDDAWARIRGLVAGAEPALLLWEAPPLPATAERLASELRVRSVVYSPAESEPDSGDWLQVMRANLDRLEAGLR